MDYRIQFKSLVDEFKGLKDSAQFNAEEGLDLETIENAIKDVRFKLCKLASEIQLDEMSPENVYRYFFFANFAHCPDPVLYARTAANMLTLDFQKHRVWCRLGEVDGGITVVTRLSEIDAQIFSCKPGIGLRKMVEVMKKEGLDPKYLFPLVPEDFA